MVNTLDEKVKAASVIGTLQGIQDQEIEGIPQRAGVYLATLVLRDLPSAVSKFSHSRHPFIQAERDGDGIIFNEIQAMEWANATIEGREYEFETEQNNGYPLS